MIDLVTPPILFTVAINSVRIALVSSSGRMEITIDGQTVFVELADLGDLRTALGIAAGARYYRGRDSEDDSGDE